MTKLSKQGLIAVLIASPVLVFPFARSYYLAYLGIIIAGVVTQQLYPAWRQFSGLRLAALALFFPVLLSSALVAVRGDFAWVFLEKSLVFFLAILLALSTAQLLRVFEVQRLVGSMISLMILFWIFDAGVQLLTGYNLWGIPGSTEFGSMRVASYFSNATHFGYFIGFFALIPAFWLLQKQVSRVWVWSVLILGASVTFAGGSRNAMLSYSVALLFLLWISLHTLSLRHKLSVMGLMGAIFVALGGVLYALSASFQERWAQTLIVLQGVDRATLNHALSHRLDIWETALPLGLQHWMTGIGVGQFNDAVMPLLAPQSIFVVLDTPVYHAHQVLLEIFVATGILGLLLFLAYYVWLMGVLFRQRASARTLGWGLLFIFLMLWLPFGTQKDFYSSDQILLSFYILGLGFGLLSSTATSVTSVGTIASGGVGFDGGQTDGRGGNAELACAAHAGSNTGQLSAKQAAGTV